MTISSLPLLYQKYKEDTRTIVQRLEVSAKTNGSKAAGDVHAEGKASAGTD